MTSLIEIRGERKNPLDNLELRIGGISYKSFNEFHTNNDEPPFKVTIRDDDLSSTIASHSFSDLAESIETLRLTTRYGFVRHPHLFHFVVIERLSAEHFCVNVTFGFSAAEWKMPWSFAEYQRQFVRIVEEQFPQYTATVGTGSIPQAVLSLPVENSSNTITNQLSTYPPILQVIHELAEQSLKSDLSQQSVLMFFDFPDEVKVPCEQYLLYFAQFLQDLGVEVNTALTHDAGQVLFTVTPDDKTEALDNIRSALEVYLHLPSSPVSDSSTESIAVQRLEATILRLRGDLKLAAAELQAKETTLEAKQLIVNIQKAMLSGEILVDSMKNITPKPEDKEDLIKGLVAVSTYKDKGLEVHLGELLRRLKARFGRSSG